VADLAGVMETIHDAMTQAFVQLTESPERHALLADFVRGRATSEPPTMRSESETLATDSSPSVPEPVASKSAAALDAHFPTKSGERLSSPQDADVSAEALRSPPGALTHDEKINNNANMNALPPSSGARPVDTTQLSAVELHAKALIALSEQRFDEARGYCRSACDLAPDNPDFLASSVWIRASSPRPDTKVLLLDLDGVLREHPDHVQARYYRGVLRRRLGSDSAAARDFDRVLELLPGHAGAASQLAELAKSAVKKR
jgi:tetratricopeptide (TPR) repeat protein